ncbi:MAG: hypothetical protein UR85_C0011G0020 [Candidatus Nomurabacteria bacterium GW2011_GWF2_35_66]|nr:MAG: hypothetical protein UR85_C0011G0020 [Candidatus Nomurabacteria bacterium GW2011_GWF2_35_66]HBM45426.1 hypothetical protein [Patescibacteria group bacterium]
MIGDIQRGSVQTSFIPKKPFVSSGQKEGLGFAGILNFVSIIVFVTALSVYGGGLFYKTILNRSIVNINKDLEKVQADFKNNDSLMREMIRFDAKLKNMNALLDNHVTLRSLFAFLEESTMSNLRFNEFGYINKSDGSIDLKLGGEATSYGTIALQAKEFVDSKKTGNKDFTDIIFSDFNPGLTGNVVFRATAKMMPDLVYYKNLDSVGSSL